MRRACELGHLNEEVHMTRQFPLLLVLAAIVALAAAPVSAAPANSTGTGLVAGSGWRIAPDGTEFAGDPRVEFKVAAKFAPGSASGTYQYANVAGGLLTGSITCGSVDAGVAVVGGHITGGNTLVGSDFYVFFMDDGAPTFGSLGPDSVSFTQIPEAGDIVGEDFPSDFPIHCPAARGQTFEVQQWLTVLGDVVVH
jgi:hypothetical protein